MDPKDLRQAGAVDQPIDPQDARRGGAVAAAVWLSVLWLASALGEASFPPAAAADRFVRLVPGDVATFFIELLQHWALRLLIAGAIAVFVLIGAVVLDRSVRGVRPRPWLAAGVMSALGLIAALVDPSDPRLIQSVVALAVAGVGFGLVARSTMAHVGADDDEVDAGRRRALRLGIAAAAGVATAGGVGGWLLRRIGGPNTDVALVAPAVPATVPERDAFPDIPGLSPEITPVADHYIVDINLFAPSVEAEGWTLRVFGEVERPLELTFAELQERYEVVEEFSVLTCVSNEIGGDLIGNSAWGGVRLRDVLRDAGVTPEGVDLVLRAADGYSDSFPVELGMDPSVLLAVSQNGKPLTQAHGFPCRVRIPKLYGMENVKWLESIEVVPRDYEGYWQQRGWADVAVVKTQSRIDVVGEGDGTAMEGFPTWIAGLAWAGERGISKVEVSTDSGKTWAPARLKQPVSDNAWTLWAYRWTPKREGRTAVGCRATDGTGARQSADETPPHPDGASGYHFVAVDVI